jgi:hypothetical protein
MKHCDGFISKWNWSREVCVHVCMYVYVCIYVYICNVQSVSFKKQPKISHILRYKN